MSSNNRYGYLYIIRIATDFSIFSVIFNIKLVRLQIIVNHKNNDLQ